MEETRYPEKTINLPQVTDKLSHNVVSSTPRLSRIRTCNISGESNYYAITTTTAPIFSSRCCQVAYLEEKIVFVHIYCQTYNTAFGRRSQLSGESNYYAITTMTAPIVIEK
jgi:hypothetical protein